MSRIVAVVLAIIAVLAAAPGVAAADTRTGGVVIVEEGETVNEDLEAMAGTVIVHGTVDGDLSALAGNVVVTGTVTGNVDALAGNLRITGDVGGDVSGGVGNAVLEGGTVDGNVDIGAGNLVVNNTVRGDVTAGSETITLGSAAVIQGALEYQAATFNRHPDARVDGEIRQVERPIVDRPLVPGWLATVYGLLVNLLLGGLLLFAFPVFSRDVATRAMNAPLRSGGVGLLALVGIPVVLLLLAITIIGIPVAVLGAFLFAFFVWIGSVYGAFTVGVWLLSLVDRSSSWLALLVGLLVVTVLYQLPFLGGLTRFLIFLLGIGALSLAVLTRYRDRRGRDAIVDDVTSTS